MKFHIITIFPEAFESFVTTSIIGKAIKKGLLSIELYKLNDFSPETSGHVDEKAFGMHGQVLSPEPLARAIESILQKTDTNIPIIYMSPSGKKLSQEYIEKYAINIQECIILCGHYEGIDQRIIDMFVTHEISLGDYVLTGGELPAQIFIDALVRLKDGVLGSSISHQEESFSQKLNRQKEYPVYTRPQDFRGKKVPDILLSGNHKEIEIWKQNNLR